MRVSSELLGASPGSDSTKMQAKKGQEVLLHSTRKHSDYAEQAGFGSLTF